jgi:restriction endonuclease Mrr
MPIQGCRGSGRCCFPHTWTVWAKDRRPGARRVRARLVLIDGTRLTELMVRQNVGVLEEQTCILKRVDEEFFE